MKKAKAKSKAAKAKRTVKHLGTPRSPKPNYPAAELNRLFTVTGRETIRGVHFDLRPDELVAQGYLPYRFSDGDDPFHNIGLTFPWSGKLPDSVLSLRAGDALSIERIRVESVGSTLDDPKDQTIKHVTFKITEKGQVLTHTLEEIQFHRADSFVYFINFKTALKRFERLTDDRPAIQSKFNAAMKRTPLDEEEVEHLSERLGFKRHDPRFRAAICADMANTWKMMCSTQDGEDRLKYHVAKAVDNATGFGYWLAKAEFLPHHRKAVSGIDRLDKAAASLRARANALWRDRARELAFALQPTLKLNRADLAEELKKRLKQEGLTAPGSETVMQSITDWYKEGLPRYLKKR